MKVKTKLNRKGTWDTVRTLCALALLSAWMAQPAKAQDDWWNTGFDQACRAAVAAGSLTVANVDNLRFDGNTISSTNTNGNVTVAPNGSGLVSFSGTERSAGSGANGAYSERGYAEELITLATGGLTTDSSANLLPANSIIQAVVCRVTTTITTATSWAVGDGTTAARFSAANSTLTAGTTSVGLAHMAGNVSTTAAGPTQAAAAKLRITAAGSNPGAGAVRCGVFYTVFVAPTS